MSRALLVDIGSTYTKAVAVDLDETSVLARGQSPTTVNEDVLLGLQRAIAKVTPEDAGDGYFTYRLGSSSAAGGLRLVAVGLMPDLTAKAARYAAESAGAKVVDTYAFKLSDEEVESIHRIDPDVVLLAGGTDGGNEEVLVHNAKALGESSLECPIIVAGNKSAADEAAQQLREGGTVDISITENVMPTLNELNVAPARDQIRQVFVDTITQAKGIDRANEVLDDVVMPTPEAVLNGAELLADTGELGELLVIEVGGATTDVHSVAEGKPTRPDIQQRGLDEPYVKRTVEGDLGIRWNASTVADYASDTGVIESFCLDRDDWEKRIQRLVRDVSDADVDEVLPDDDLALRTDAVLAYIAAEEATDRHAGHIEQHMTPEGELLIQQGKDLTDVPTVIGAGGVLVNNSYRGQILEAATFDESKADRLKPKAPTFYYDSQYLLYAVGLLYAKDIRTDAAAEIFLSESLARVETS